ncbi:MAG: bifunctional 5,10-methylenetetrahydrofolate dehydrogenase/5,10-methenyltetrahydrofolate cyclohydrolase [Candidatus Pacebacteria bacterium]|nr:bifunctional 5,10-methylenetetrahydrofolate dehydrogenase/5,10-methenyltetrahydrofolate cyclohydrolase [Candidatus Paceibacterota bacterium]
MLVDGKVIAADILAEVAELTAARPKAAPCLSAITCAPNFETKKYLEMKKAKAVAAGIELSVIELPVDVSIAEAVACITQVAAQSDGVVVQLPFPPHIDRAALIAAVPVEKDPDGFRYGEVLGACFSPVVGAIDEISKRHGVEWEGKHVVILGEGVLVGRPAAAYARERGAEVIVLTKETYDESKLRPTDIIISGIGQPHFIKPDMVKEGVVIFDAGTSEEGGVLVGDVDPEVGSKASLLTPVPGGIGPITISYLLRNLVSLTFQDK